jgi:predicted PurR-regulated permease PerM
LDTAVFVLVFNSQVAFLRPKLLDKNEEIIENVIPPILILISTIFGISLILI